MYKSIIVVLAAAMVFVIGGSPAMSHEFIVKPVQLNVPVGHKLPFSVVSAHVFMISEEMEPVEQVSLSLVKGDENRKLTLKPNEILLTLDGVVELRNEGTYILAGHRKGMIWTQTTQGWKQAGKKNLKGVISSGKYEKFCKTIITAGQPDNDCKKILGHQLEIVPVDDPARAVIGKDLRFRILFNGKPMPANVYATYDGFTAEPNTYAYFTETNADGQARVRITHQGTWMVRVQHELNESTPDYDKHVLRAVFVFEVN